MTHTLEAVRYDERVTYRFTPLKCGKVRAWPSYGSPQELSLTDARRLYASLLRKGWAKPQPVDVPF